jgi:hypothetical protein
MALPGRDGILGGVRPSALLALAAALVLAAAAGRADELPVQAGDRLEPFELADQHGQPGRVDESVRVLLFTADMDAGDVVKGALEADPALQDLAAHGAVWVSDIHRMPAVVTRLFALPSMRRRPYRMLLDRGPGPSARIPREEGKVSVLVLDALAVQSIAFADQPDAIAAALRAR